MFLSDDDTFFCLTYRNEGEDNAHAWRVCNLCILSMKENMETVMKMHILLQLEEECELCTPKFWFFIISGSASTIAVVQVEIF